MLLSRAFGTVIVMKGELQKLQTQDHLEFFVSQRLVNSTSVASETLAIFLLHPELNPSTLGNREAQHIQLIRKKEKVK
jgi:hypothetical protein